MPKPVRTATLLHLPRRTNLRFMSVSTSDELRSLLEALSSVQNDGDRLDVEFTDRSRVIDEQTVGVSTRFDYDFSAGPNELRVIVDRLSHQVWHLRTNARPAIREFMAEHPAIPHIAGLVRNLVDDAYVDKRRTNEFKGLRRTLAFRADAAMADDDRRPPLNALSRELALVEGTCQLAMAGYVNGLDGVDDDVRAFLARTRDRLSTARGESSAAKRAALARKIVADLRAHAAVPVAADEYARSGTFPTDAVPSVRRRTEPRPLSVMGVLQATREATVEVFGTLGRITLFTLVALVGLFVEALRALRVLAALRWLAEALRLASLWRWLVDRFVPDFGSADSQKRDETAQALEARLEAAGHSADLFLAADGSLPTEVDPAEFDPKNVDADALRTVPPEALADMTHTDLEALGSAPDGDSNSTREAERDAIKLTADRSSAADWYQLDGDIEYDHPDSDTERQWQALRDTASRADGGLAGRTAERDATATRNADSSDVRAELNQRGVVREIEAAFDAVSARGREIAAPRGQRLDVRAAVRRQSGALDERNVYRRHSPGAGTRTVGVAVDLSQSMDVFEAKVALGALAKTTTLTGDEFVASGFATNREDGNRVVTPLVTGPSEPFRWRHLDAISQWNDTPTASGIRDVRTLLTQSHAKEQLLIVVTDGKPNVPLDDTRLDGDAAIADAKAEVRRTRQEHSITLIGLAVGDDVDEATMRTVFGDRGYVRSDRSNFAERLLDVYRNQGG